MSQFHDLPNEIILKILSYLKVKDLLYCGQVSKRIRAVSHDKSLYQKINLNGKKVQTRFLERIINKGCKDLNLSRAQLEGSEFNLNEMSELRCLNLDFCVASIKDMKVLTDSCVNLQMISIRNLTKFSLSSITSKIMENICNQNGQTLEVLNLESHTGTVLSGAVLSEDLIWIITEKCAVLKEVNFNNTGLSYDSIDILVKNLTPSVQSFSLQHCYSVGDWQIDTLVKRCNQIRFLDLKYTGISSNCLPEIIRNLKDSLEELNFQTYYFDFIQHENSLAKLFGLKSLTKFKTLRITICGFMEKRLKEELFGVVIDNQKTDGKFCCS